ncbi:hypothetical protein FVE85_2363 [Porphyridium purpureum]|uniref:Uncharacterized protein n=1 Tax=Porphyridium purpureum TaxID=35688 RepID=A0A5J4YYK8_PORPP|nr:hypothetical protein FVE85_2363 [Porphyridium purpureum]|eukprot:POR0386..scf209_3
MDWSLTAPLGSKFAALDACVSSALHGTPLIAAGTRLGSTFVFRRADIEHEQPTVLMPRPRFYNGNALNDVTCVGFSADASALAVASAGAVVVWDLQQPAASCEVTRFAESAAPHVCFALEDFNVLACCSGTKPSVAIWDVRDASREMISLQTSGIRAQWCPWVPFSVVTLSNSDGIKLWDLRMARSPRITVSTTADNPFVAMHCSPNVNWPVLATGDRIGRLQLWQMDAHALQPLRTVNLPLLVHSLRFVSPDARGILLAGSGRDKGAVTSSLYLLDTFDLSSVHEDHLTHSLRSMETLGLSEDSAEALPLGLLYTTGLLGIYSVPREALDRCTGYPVSAAIRKSESSHSADERILQTPCSPPMAARMTSAISSDQKQHHETLQYHQQRQQQQQQMQNIAQVHRQQVSWDDDAAGVNASTGVVASFSCSLTNSKSNDDMMFSSKPGSSSTSPGRSPPNVAGEHLAGSLSLPVLHSASLSIGSGSILSYPSEVGAEKNSQQEKRQINAQLGHFGFFANNTAVESYGGSDIVARRADDASLLAPQADASPSMQMPNSALLPVLSCTTREQGGRLQSESEIFCIGTDVQGLQWDVPHSTGRVRIWNPFVAERKKGFVRNHLAGQYNFLKFAGRTDTATSHQVGALTFMDFVEACDHNAKVASQAGEHEVCVLWQSLHALFCRLTDAHTQSGEVRGSDMDGTVNVLKVLVLQLISSLRDLAPNESELIDSILCFCGACVLVPSIVSATSSAHGNVSSRFQEEILQPGLRLRG